MASQAGEHLRLIVGDNLARAKAERDVTDMEIAVAIGADPQQVAKWRKGQHMPNPDRIAGLAKFFDRDLAWFYEDRREPVAA